MCSHSTPYTPHQGTWSRLEQAGFFTLWVLGYWWKGEADTSEFIDTSCSSWQLRDGMGWAWKAAVRSGLSEETFFWTELFSFFFFYFVVLEITWGPQTCFVRTSLGPRFEKQERVEVGEATGLVSERTVVFDGGQCSMSQNWGLVVGEEGMSAAGAATSQDQCAEMLELSWVQVACAPPAAYKYTHPDSVTCLTAAQKLSSVLEGMLPMLFMMWHL